MRELQDYVLHLADTHLILGQRLGEWCGHNFVLEQDIAMSNIALDLFGQCRSLYQYAADLGGGKQTEDQLAFMRGERHYKNLLLVEQPNGDFAFTLARQFFFDVYHQLLCEALTKSSDKQLQAIAEKSLKEVRYHLTWSSEWMIRLGDGTDESHQRIQHAVNELWMWTHELTSAASYEKGLDGVVPDPTTFKAAWRSQVKKILDEATLLQPADETIQSGGKEGIHTEHLGFILSEMQMMQRTYPGMTW
jgi:ring-1,2-phenylacetyl-CoA epoxidase subunit PaaC